MKSYKFLVLSAFCLLHFSAFAQNRSIARGATSGELYVPYYWYQFYDENTQPYNIVRLALFHLTDNGKKLTIPYDVDYFAEISNQMMPGFIHADATSGALYNTQTYIGSDQYVYTQLWVSFDYGKNWILREEGIGNKGYATANVNGFIYRGDSNGLFKSIDFGLSFENVPIPTFVYGVLGECGLESCEFWNFKGSAHFYQLVHTMDCRQTYTFYPIDSLFVQGEIWGIFPDVYRGGEAGEVYVSSMFPDPENNNRVIYKASFSADTGHTFRHVYASESFDSYTIPPMFMSDREPDIFYVIRRYHVNNGGSLDWHTKLCIEYYRDYGETLVDIYCHDLTKDYGKTCETVTDLISEKCSPNCIQLAWSEPESSLPIEGYRIFRNEQLLNEQLTIDTSFFDENLPNGEYEYYVVTHYTTGCVSDTSNHVEETINVEESCEPVNNLVSEKCNNTCVLLTWSEPESSLLVEGYHIFRNEQLLNEQLTIDTSFFDEDLPNGDYEYYIITHYTNSCVSDSSNHVAETIELGVKELKELEEVRVFPNPTTGELRITNYELRIKDVEVFDVYGRKQKAERRKGEKENGKVVMDISELHSGIYFVKITTEKGIITRKVVKY